MSRLLIFVCLLAGLFTSCGTVREVGRRASSDTLSPQEQRRYDYCFLEAVRQKALGKHDATFDLLQHCLAIRPDAPSALYELSQYYLYLKQPQQAVSALVRAVGGDPDNYWYAQALSNLYLQQDEREKAEVLLRQMTVRFPTKADPLYALLDIYNRVEQFDKVIEVLDRMEQLAGKNEQISMEKYRIYLQMKQNEKARQEIEALVREYPAEPRYRVLLGDFWMQTGRGEEALRIYRDVLDEEPDNAQARYALAFYYEATGQKEQYDIQLDSLLFNKKVEPSIKLTVMRRMIVEGEQVGADSTRVIRLFDRMLAEEPDDASLPLLYAQYLISKNLTQQSLPVLRQVLDIDPTNTASRMMLLGEAVKKEDYDDIVRLCEAGVESNPDMLEFYFYLAIAYNHEERADDALAICRKALTRVTETSKKEVVSDFYAIIGDVCHSKGENTEAYEAYEQALAYNADNISVLNNYAYYLSLERRDLDRAEEMSYRTVKAEPHNGTYLDTYAWILFEKGNYTQARIYMDEAMKDEESLSADVVEHCGDIYAMTGEVEQAVAYWKQAQQMGSTSKTLKRKIAEKRYIGNE